MASKAAAAAFIEGQRPLRQPATLGEQPKLMTRLTSRERIVLQRLAEGLTHKEIAQVEQVSLRTIERTIASLESKLGASNQFLLGKKAEHFGLLF